jgi:hypothetical protein
MNSFENHIRLKRLNEIESMNALQDAGIVSDNCVLACDVAESDCTQAIAFLALRGLIKQRPEPKPEQREMPFSRQPYPD